MIFYDFAFTTGITAVVLALLLESGTAALGASGGKAREYAVFCCALHNIKSACDTTLITPLIV